MKQPISPRGHFLEERNPYGSDIPQYYDELIIKLANSLNKPITFFDKSEESIFQP